MSVKNTGKWLVFVAVMVAGFTSQAGSNYELRKSVLAGGALASSGSYSVRTAIGQSIVQPSAGGNYEFNPGFFQQNRDLIFINKFESNS